MKSSQTGICPCNVACAQPTVDRPSQRTATPESEHTQYLDWEWASGSLLLYSICQQIWKTQQWPQDWKRSVFIPILKEDNAKDCSNKCTIALISHNSKVMLKILQARLQQYVNHELLDVQAGFRKGRGTRDQVANIRWIIEKAIEFQKKSTFALLTMPKPLTVWITRNCGNFFKRWEYQIS